MKLTEEVKKHINGATFISIDSLTPVKLTGGKTNPQQGKVMKLMEGGSCVIFQNKKANGYAAMVKRRLELEGKSADAFELGPRAWGTRVPNTPFVEHDGKDYLEVIFQNPGKITYLLDGKVIQKSEIIGLKDHEEGEQGGLEDKVVIRTFNVDNIIKIKIDKHVFINR